MTIKANGAVYKSLTNSDFKIKLSGYAVNSAASRESVMDAYADYEGDGNAEMIERMGQ